MKQLIQNFKTGALSLEDVPPPALRAGGVLVRNVCSLISAGTERGMIDLARKSLLEKARARPDLVRKVMDKARTEGVLTAYQKAMQRLETPMPLGYSSAGVVVSVGEGVTDLEAGDPVACAGIGYAGHAEVVFVPRNLCVRMPRRGNGKELGFDEAAYTTLGAIALEGVRVADVRLGETVVILGLGLVGLLTVQILKAAGCRVIGMDPNPDRCRLAEELGCHAVAADREQVSALCSQWSDGYGADAVLIAAATNSSEPIRLAGELARDRGRVVIVGIVGSEIPRKLYYEKALDLRMSRSYGPGRYDRFYEEKGIDYPIGYVRWTENRNMSAFLQLVADDRVSLSRLTTHRFPIDKALDAYRLITEGAEPHIGVLLTYPQEEPLSGDSSTVWMKPRPTVSQARPRSSNGIGVSVIGAGSFATGILLPALSQLEGVTLRGVCSQGGLNACTAASRLGFAYCTSDQNELFKDPETDAVLIVTRPASHADLVTRALEAGKHVFVEKPPAVCPEEMQSILRTFNDQRSCILMVGYNRRFSPFGQQLKAFFAHRSGPLVALYRVNANAPAKDDRQHDPEEGGGRIIGEAGHFVDLLCHVIGSTPESVYARAVGGNGEGLFRHENVAVTIRFADGSIGNIVYVSHGAAGFSKERLEVFGDGATGVLEDFRSLELVRGSRRKMYRNRLSQDKGHHAELAAFVKAVRQGEPAPVSLGEYLVTSLCTFQAVESLRTGLPQTVCSAWDERV